MYATVTFGNISRAAAAQDENAHVFFSRGIEDVGEINDQLAKIDVRSGDFEFFGNQKIAGADRKCREAPKSGIQLHGRNL